MLLFGAPTTLEEFLLGVFMLIDFEGDGRCCCCPFDDFLLFGLPLMKFRSDDGECLLLVPILFSRLNLRHTFRLMMKRTLEEGYFECHFLFFCVVNTRVRFFLSHTHVIEAVLSYCKHRKTALG